MFFYAYVLTLVGAGASGVLLARYDLRWLVGLHLGSLRPSIEANLGGQYRFLRSIELGFGLFALTYRREIFACASSTVCSSARWAAASSPG